MTTLFQDNAAEFATTPEQAIDFERNSARRKAIALIAEGRTGRAQYELARSVIRQARIAGLGTQEIAPACPCGGSRCPR